VGPEESRSGAHEPQEARRRFDYTHPIITSQLPTAARREVGWTRQRKRGPAARSVAAGGLALTRYWRCQYSMVMATIRGGRVGGRMLRISRAIVRQ